MKIFRGLLGWAAISNLLIFSPEIAMAEFEVFQFEEVANEAGISYVGPSWGSMWGDFDGDSRPDIWLVNHFATPSLYLNQGNGSFIDILSQVVSPTLWMTFDAHGVAWADFDNDGDQDLYQLADEGENGPLPALLFVNNGGQFVESAGELGLDYPPGRGRMPMWFDYDRDGLLDVIHPTTRRVGTADGPTAIFHQRLTSFSNVSEQVGLELNDTETNDFAQLADMSGDGNLELLVHMNGYPGQVYNLSTEPFEDIKTGLGLTTTASVIDAVVGDLDGDLDNDIFMVRGSATQGFAQVDDFIVETHLEGSDGIERGISFCTEGNVSIDVWPRWQWNEEEVFIGADGLHPLELSFSLSPTDTTSWGVFPHGPGDPGLYVGYDPNTLEWQILRSEKIANLVVESTLVISELSAIGWDPEELPEIDRFLVNQGDSFSNETANAGFVVPSSGRSVVAGDFDNDMDLDLYIVSTGPVENFPNILYENQGSGFFSAVPDAGGAAGSSLGRGDSATVADYNSDGFLDLLVTNGVSKPPFERDGPTFLFKNLGNDNHWIEFELEGVNSNRDGVGAQLVATSGGVIQLREQGGGTHCRGQNHQRIHFGLGGNSTVDFLSVRWPNGVVQEIYNIPADQIVRLIEPDPSGILEPTETPSVAALLGCYPNPFNPGTTIAFSLTSSQSVKLSIHDVAGRLVKRLLDGENLSVGKHEIVWDGRDHDGQILSSGLYFYTLNAGQFTETKRMVLVK